MTMTDQSDPTPDAATPALLSPSSTLAQQSRLQLSNQTPPQDATSWEEHQHQRQQRSGPEVVVAEADVSRRPRQ